MRLFRSVASLVAIAVFVVLPGAVDSTDATSGRSPLQPFCRLVLDRHNSFTRLVPDAARQMRSLTASASTTTITVVYDAGFQANAAAQAAFQAAVNIWQQNVASTVPIVVSASFRDLVDSSLLAQGGPNGVAFSTGPPAWPNTWYPMPLFNKLLGIDYNGSAVEVVVTFNSVVYPSSACGTGTEWYFGTDGVPHAGCVDFESVALHELGHGLGFLGAGSVGVGGTVRARGSDPYGNPVNYPYIYDQFTVDAAGRALVDTTAYPDGSAALADALTGIGGGVFWNGPNGISANAGVRPRLYAPNPWEQGSSYSHLDDATFLPGTANSLMTHAIGYAEVIHEPGPITLGMFQDMGWGAPPPPCTYAIAPTSASFGTTGGPGSVTVTATAGCAWTATSNAPSIAAITGGASGTGSGTVSYSVLQNANTSQRSATLTIAGQLFTITQAGTGPTVALDRTSLTFGATNNGITFVSRTSAQLVRLTQSGGIGTASWTATSNQPWLVVSPSSGSGSATLSIGVQSAGILPINGTVTGTVSLAFNGAGNSAGPIVVSLTIVPDGVSAAPIGAFDTPADNSTGVTGSIGVTGWALDDVEVTTVKIYRDSIAGEPFGLVFIGDASFVDGARPDVAYAAYPRNTRAGWGYLMLTNMLPNRGDGAYVLSAYAFDAEGHSTRLGIKTIVCANSLSTTPFGAIDTPGQGETVSGTVGNFGWVLASGTDRRADPPGGGTVRVWIDSQPVGTPSGWTSRGDITALFPAVSYPGVNNALGVFGFDSRTLVNGVHTIAWSVLDNKGGVAGVGSRFFTVSNGSSLTVSSTTTQAATMELAASPQRLDFAPLARSVAVRAGDPAVALRDEVAAAPLDSAPVAGRRGYDLDVPFRRYRAATTGTITIQSEEIDRIELRLSAGGRHRYSGYMRTEGGLGPLPIGSHLDPTSGAFAWQPAVGFVGPYDLVFVRWSAGRAVARQEVRVVVNPKGSGRVGPQVVIDVPSVAASGSSRTETGVLSGVRLTVDQPFVVAGWAADLDAEFDTGIDTIHVWAYPIENGRYGIPIFLGVATMSGRRPDVAAVYGERFRDSGYGLLVHDMPPGEYDVAVFPHSAASGEFLPAKLARVAVR